jgi:WD40 repeat protein
LLKRSVDYWPRSSSGQPLTALLTRTTDRLVKTFDAVTLEQRLVLSGHRGAVNAVCVRDGVIVSASGDRTIRLWAAETGELLSALPQQARGISSLDFDGRFVLSGSSDSCVRHVDLLDPQHGLGRMYDQALCAGAHNGMGEGATYACGCRCGGTVEGHTDLVSRTQRRRRQLKSQG